MSLLKIYLHQQRQDPGIVKQIINIFIWSDYKYSFYSPRHYWIQIFFLFPTPLLDTNILSIPHAITEYKYSFYSPLHYWIQIFFLFPTPLLDTNILSIPHAITECYKLPRTTTWQCYCINDPSVSPLYSRLIL